MTAAAIDIGAARRHASEKVRKSGTSFAAGMAILPKKRREAMHAIYAFCREIDDIADCDLPAAEKIRRLWEWRGEIDHLYAGRPATPIGAALLEPVRAYGLPKQEFTLLIEGMEMDADGPIVAPKMERLFAYTRRVAGAVGMLSMPVFGAARGEAADRFALSLGDALQLTNILRDVAEDAKIGRVYLPTELLEKHGAAKSALVILEALRSPSPVLHGRGVRGEGLATATSDALQFDEPSPTAPLPQAGEESPLAAVAQDLAAIAAQKFADARAALADIDWRKVRPALLMMGVYEAYLQKMKDRGWEQLGEPVSLSKTEKLLIAARYALAPPLRAKR